MLNCTLVIKDDAGNIVDELRLSNVIYSTKKETRYSLRDMADPFALELFTKLSLTGAVDAVQAEG